MLARLQKIITLTLLAAAIGWFSYFAGSAPVLAVSGALMICFGYSALFLVEFALLRFVNRQDPVPQPTWRELLQAWVGETMCSPTVFFWRQPFRSNRFPDQLAPESLVAGRRGVVFVHGFFCNRGIWNPWLKRLQGSGHACIAVNLEPIFGSIDDYALQIESAVARITKATGLAPLLVCHSMGGLAARAWLRHSRGEARVYRVVTIGTPHRGTWLSRFGHGHNGRQMRLASDWQAGLDHGMPPDRHGLFICWYSSSDNIVFPTSTATLPGADNRLVRGAAHVQMAFRRDIMRETLALLGGKYPFN